MKKFTKIVLISAVCMLVFGLLVSCSGVFWVYRAASSYEPTLDITAEQTLSLDMDTLQNINIELGVSDISFMPISDPSMARVVATGFTKEELSMAQDDGTLNISTGTSPLFNSSMINVGRFRIDWNGRLHLKNTDMRTITVFISPAKLTDVSISGDFGNMTFTSPANASDVLFDADSIEISNGTGNLSMGYVGARRMSISGGMGNVSVKNFTVDQLNVNCGTGNLLLSGGSITQSASISGGMGDIQLNDVSVRELSADIGTGAFRFGGTMRGNCTISGGMGNIILDFKETAQNHWVRVDRGLGDLNVSNANMVYSEDTYTINPDLKTDNMITVSMGTGNVSITFEEE